MPRVIVGAEVTSLRYRCAPARDGKEVKASSRRLLPFKQALTLSLLLLVGGLLPELKSAPSDPTSLRAYVEKSQRRQAYGVYVKSRKFGWAVDELKVGQFEGREVAVVTFEMQGSFTSAGEASRFEEKSATYYELEGKGEILFAEERVVEDGNETRRTMTRNGREFEIATRSRGGDTTRRVPIPKETLSLMRDMELWLARPLKRGAKFESYSTSWDQAEIDSRETYTFRSKKTILWGGIRTGVYSVTVHVDGMVLDFDVTADGTPLKGMMGGLFELRAEKEAIAKKPSAEPIDMLQASSIKTDKNLGEPETIDSLTLQISGLGSFQLPTSHRQRQRSKRGSTLVLELSRDFRAAAPAPLSPKERDEFLKPTPSLPADHPAIRAKARQIIADETGPLQMATLLQEWVFRHARQTMAANQASALDVLNSLAGDCTEITLLFVALARASGLPAREVGGVMFVNEGAPIFGWHAWAEIHDGHQWVSIDPTWNQVYVDGTHLKLSEDSADLSWVNLLGKMKIKILKFTRTK
jgi:hypothetical protein